MKGFDLSLKLSDKQSTFVAVIHAKEHFGLRIVD